MASRTAFGWREARNPRRGRSRSRPPQPPAATTSCASRHDFPQHKMISCFAAMPKTRAATWPARHSWAMATQGSGAHDLGPPLPADYDSDPGRFASNQAATAMFSRRGDVHPFVARRLAEVGCELVLDIGGGNGALARELGKVGVRCITADRAFYVADAPRPVLRADASMLSVREGSFSGVVALWALYHLANPSLALDEMSRCLRTGGVAVACAPSRYNDPELSAVLPRWGQPLSFDAENGPDQVARAFGEVEVETWDEPMVALSGPEELALFLRGRGLAKDDATAAAHQIETPLTVTKRGMLAWARK